MTRSIDKIAINIEDLTKIYDEDVRAVDGISFSVKEGEIFSFLGPNGAGKSTTIGIAATNLQPTSGNVEIFGKNIQTETKDVRKMIGICPQDIVIYEHLTIMENLIFFGKMYDKPIKELKKYALELIEHVGLGPKKNVLAKKLSGGMKRRLNLIIGLVNDPDLVFLDEPTAGLDPQSRRLIWDFLLKLKSRGKTIFLTTHYMDEADMLSDRVAIIDEGKIIALDSPFDLKREYSEGDIIELKFQQADEVVNQKLQSQDEKAISKQYTYVEEDNLFRITSHNGLLIIPKLIEELHSLALIISDMNIKANSLENVFLSLTGRSLRQ
jgi:ABC-2 type transport system ATP-binding protein